MIGDRIKKARTQKEYTLEEVAAKVGVSRQTICRYETGVIKSIPSDMVERLSKALGVTPAFLMGWEDLPPGAIPFSGNHKIPILGRIAAGLPIYAESQVEGYTVTDLNGGAEYFGLRVQGDSMSAARIQDGDILIVRRQDTAENGQIAVVMVDGDEATVKRWYQAGDMVTLMPQSLNPQHRPQVYDTKKTTVRIIGLVVRIEITL